MLLDILGVIGVVLILIAYILLQTEKIRSTQIIYPLLNLIGSILITISLLQKWNLSAFLMEVSWAGISIWGIWHIIQKKREKKDDAGI